MNHPLPKILTGYHLKVIAVVSMLIDHFAYIPLASVLSASYSVQDGSAVYDGFRQSLLLWVAERERFLWALSDGMHWVGRLAFPLFCFLLVQGFVHTRDRRKYALRLGLFAVISEVPYDMAFNNCLLSFRNNNVFFTLLAGLLMIWAIEGGKNRLDRNREKGGGSGKLLYPVLTAGIVLAALFLVVKVLDSSYSASGILAILILYLLREKPVGAVVVSVLVLTVLNLSFIELFALPAAVLAGMYNRERGRAMKYVFYAFYPAHLLVFALAAMCLGSMPVHMGFMA